jgi:uncharacterized membrane protein
MGITCQKETTAMKRIIILVGLVLSLAAASEAKSRYSGRSVGRYGTGSSSAYEQVDGYTRKDGTYVAPYYRTRANNTTADNYGTYGNYNPWTGTYGNIRNDD